MDTNDILDPNWYADTGPTTYMTSNPGNLLSCSSYTGSDKIFVDDGRGLSISHAGYTVLPSSP